MLLIYAPIITNRLTYIVTTLLGNDTIVTNNLVTYHNHTTVKINYSPIPIIEGEIQIIPHEILFARDITPYPIAFSSWNNLTTFFPSEGTIPFDLFGAAFYLLSSYEQYLPHPTDRYGRFDHTHSTAFKGNFLQIPLINHWLKAFENTLQQQFPQYQLPSTQFQFIPTFDVDIAYAYLGKPLWLQIAGFIKDALQLKWKQILTRTKVLFNISLDPFDVFDWLSQLHEKYQINPIYFFLMAEMKGQYDKNIPTSNPMMQQLIQSIAKHYPVGIHPSWQSGDDTSLIAKELHALQQQSGLNITQSRQHYLRLSLPQTYRQLIALGITKEYSLGYGGTNGFSASYCHPFFWYDLEKDATTPLQLYPFCFMDATCIFSEHISAEAAYQKCLTYYQQIKQLNGTCIFIFHNHFLGDATFGKAWRKCYEDLLAYHR